MNSFEKYILEKKAENCQDQIKSKYDENNIIQLKKL